MSSAFIESLLSVYFKHFLSAQIVVTLGSLCHRKVIAAVCESEALMDHPAVLPLSMLRILPVMNSEASDKRKTAQKHPQVLLPFPMRFGT
jgi:hypothetical protein